MVSSGIVGTLGEDRYKLKNTRTKCFQSYQKMFLVNATPEFTTLCNLFYSA